MADTPSTSSSTDSLPNITDLETSECVVCLQPAHGNHFGVMSCRACAAFFRRVFISHQQTFQCKYFSKCVVDNGKWSCKKCRRDKCFSVGMKPDNIQHDRDVFNSSQTFVENRKRRKIVSMSLDQLKIPMSMERLLGTHHIGLFVHQNTSMNDDEDFITYCDLSPLIDKISGIIIKTKNPAKETDYSLSSLENLAQGLKKIRESQMTKDLKEMKEIGLNETWANWNREVGRAATWIMCFPEFQELKFEEKMTIVKCMWHLFSRLERIAMTAEMRYKQLCDENDFVYSSDGMINYDRLKVDMKWVSHCSREEIIYFLGPITTWFCEQLVQLMVEIQPDDVELSFVISNLCFHLTGKKLGGKIQEITTRLEDVLANDLHNYYINKRMTRYSYRLTRILSINQRYQQLMLKRREGFFLASVLNLFRVKMSHPELFQYST